nr:uncharacterized protein LOC112725072 [Arachis hypogaea]
MRIPSKVGRIPIIKEEGIMEGTKDGTTTINNNDTNKTNHTLNITKANHTKLTNHHTKGKHPNQINHKPLKSPILQGQKELQTTLASSLTGLTSTLQAPVARLKPPSTPTPQASSSSALPSQPLPNPKGGINAITLRSETKLQERIEPSPIEITQDEDVVEIEEVKEENEAQEVVEEMITQPRGGKSKDGDVLQEAAPIPFPTLARKTKKQVELDPKMVEMFKKVKVTIPLFDAIRQVPKCAKFLKDLCMHKEKICELETIPLESSISALMDGVAKKCGDPNPCLVTCTIDGVQFVDCMCNLGACVSIMLLSVYEVLKLPPLKRLAARFVLADKSRGWTSSMLLGRPFLKTSWFKSDAFLGTYLFEIDGRKVSFNLDKAMRHPLEDHSIFRCDLIDNVVAEVHQDG